MAKFISTLSPSPSHWPQIQHTHFNCERNTSCLLIRWRVTHTHTHTHTHTEWSNYAIYCSTDIHKLLAYCTWVCTVRAYSHSLLWYPSLSLSLSLLYCSMFYQITSAMMILSCGQLLYLYLISPFFYLYISFCSIYYLITYWLFFPSYLRIVVVFVSLLMASISIFTLQPRQSPPRYLWCVHDTYSMRGCCSIIWTRKRW